jgi:hypothetical protein
MITFERIAFDEMDWESAAQTGSMNIFQSRPWLDFLTERQPLEPVTACIREHGELRGFFVGLIAVIYSKDAP